MKTGMFLGLILSITLVTGVSAMEMMDSGSMMDHPPTMTGSMAPMMSHDTMMKKPMGGVVSVAKYYGYTWKTDRGMLAQMAGITDYRGTARQNLMIRAYLLKMNTMMSHDTMMK